MHIPTEIPGLACRTPRIKGFVRMNAQMFTFFLDTRAVVTGRGVR